MGWRRRKIESEQGSTLLPGRTTTPIKLQALRLAVCQVKPFFSCEWGGEGCEGAGDGWGAGGQYARKAAR